MLLRETFEGPGGSIYLDRGAALLQTLQAVTAEQASEELYPGGATIAGHCAHLTYYMRASCDGMTGREQVLDWPSSWRPRQVTDLEWEKLKGRIRGEYLALVETIERIKEWNSRRVGDSVAVLAHTAYHVGAIRHIASRAGWNAIRVKLLRQGPSRTPGISHDP